MAMATAEARVRSAPPPPMQRLSASHPLQALNFSPRTKREDLHGAFRCRVEMRCECCVYLDHCLLFMGLMGLFVEALFLIDFRGQLSVLVEKKELQNDADNGA